MNPTIGNALLQGGIAAQEMAQDSAGQSSTVDVWTQSNDWMANTMQAAAQSPSGILAGNSTQFARAGTSWLSTPAASANQIEDSIRAQADALGQTVDALGQAHGPLETVGTTFAVLTGVEQMLSTVFSAIPFPALPAVRILDFDIGFPHAHAHPPNLVPPAPPVPLPSTGPVIPIPILSGASKTLINGMPAGRCGDWGLGIWCGGYFPMYEVFLGSSNVWIEGARAARLLVDITKHCTFTIPKPSDPPLGLMLGTTISASPNVRIGGIPLPSFTALAVGALLKGVFRIAGKGASTFGRKTAPLRKRMADKLGLKNGFLKCKVLRAEPVNFITGEVIVQQSDYVLPGLIPIAWARYYGSHGARKGACGFGWSTPADARLAFEEDGAVVFHDGLGDMKVFPDLPSRDTVQELMDGASLEATHDTLRVHLKSDLTYVFRRTRADITESRVQRVEDRSGNYLNYVRDAGGLREIVASAGRRIVVKSHHGLVREMWLQSADSEPPHLLVRYEYSEHAELLAVYDALARPYQFRYEHLRLVQHTDRNGLSFFYAYENARPAARCTRSWGDGGLYDYRFAHDPFAKRVTVTDSVGGVSTIQLNELNLPIWEIDALKGITRFEYDECGRTTSVTNQDGHRTTYEYDARGNLLKLTLPDGRSLSASFNEQNKATAIANSGGSKWEQKWDERGLLLEQISPLGHASRYEYNRQGLPVVVVNRRGARTELHYDRLGQVTHIVDGCSQSTRFAYDGRGNLVEKIDALERKTLYHHDANDRLTAVLLPSGASMQFTHDSEGNLVRYVDANGAETRLEYTGQGELARRIQADGRTVQYHYDTEERLIGVTNQRGERYQFKRDALGRIVEEVDYWGQSRHYRYSPGGHIRETRDALDRKISYATDPLGRILSKIYPDAARPDRTLAETFSYDASGNLVAAAGPHGTVRRRFDNTGRMVEERQGEHFTIYNSYDAVGNRVARKTVLERGGVTTTREVRFMYDQLDRALEMAVDDQSPSRFERDALGRIVTEQLSSGLRRDHEYSPDGYLTRQRLRLGAKDVIDTKYVYDAVGNLLERRDSQTGVDQYVYDPLGRIVQHIDPAGALRQFLADPAGDLLSTRVQRNGAWSRVGAAADTSYRFDRLGNLIERRDARGAVEFAWDAQQRLIESRRNGAATTYEYDACGRRTGKQTGDRKSYFYWDGDALVGEEQPQYRYEYLYYPNTFEPISRLATRTGAAGETVHYHNDPNGCPMKLTDDCGMVRWAASFSVWGEVTHLHANDADNALRLQGHYFDVETGLHYNRHRYYDPRIGQFASPDPLGLVAGENLFRFADNPFSWIDPHGLSCETWNEFQKHHKGTFHSPAEAAAAYHALRTGNSPWPHGFTPVARVLPPGTRLNMALGTSQPSIHPGEFATVDAIPDIAFVRNELAVKYGWKKDVNRVVTYEVTRPLPVNAGPIGPQIDQTLKPDPDQYLKGGATQVQLDVDMYDRMKYLKIIDETPIH